MTDKLLCPWCGREMRIYCDEYGIKEYRSWAECKNNTCTAEGPMVIRDTKEAAIEDATAAALRRYEPPCRPLTLEEVKERVAGLEAAPLWVDDNDEPSNAGWTYGHIVRDWLDGYSEPYGYGWRCWPRKPTEEERRQNSW